MGQSAAQGRVGFDVVPYESRGSNTILAAADNGKVIDLTATFTQTFTAAATLGAGWNVKLRNGATDRTVVVTLDPNGSETIDGLTTLVLIAGAEVQVVCTGSAFVTRTIGKAPVLPRDLTGIGAWYDAADASTITASSGLVSQLNDKSGRANHLTAATTARPTTGTRTINGLNTLDFDGSANQLRNTTPFLGGANGAIYIVLESDTASGTLVFFRGQSGATGVWMVGTTFRTITLSTTNDIAGVIAAATPMLLCLDSAGGNSRPRGNGSYGTIATLGFSTAWTQINLGCDAGGGSAFFNGKFAEAFALEETDWAADLMLRNYLAAKWGVTA